MDKPKPANSNWCAHGLNGNFSHVSRTRCEALARHSSRNRKNTRHGYVFEMTSEVQWKRAALPAVTLVLAGLIPVAMLV